MVRKRNRTGSTAVVLALAAGLAACARPEPADQVEVEIRGTDPGAAVGAPAAAPAPAPTSGANGGIVDYGDYQVAVAGEGETVADLAARVGVPATELAAYNGVQPSTELRAGDELVLPPGAADRAAVRPVAGGEEYAMAALPGTGGVEVAPLPPAAEAAAALEPVETAPGEIEPVPAEPAALSAPDPASAPEAAPRPAPATGRDWSPDLAAAAIERTDEPENAADGGLPPPPSADEPLPPAPVPPEDLSSPDLARYQTPEGKPDTVALMAPVEGPVAVPYNVGPGPQRNEGVDFAAPAGAPVVAAEAGEVALISESLGGLGTIVLVRHPDDLMTVYGRLADVTVQKGDHLERGQQVGVVADAPAGTEPRMHFEVRRGAESVDPTEML